MPQPILPQSEFQIDAGRRLRRLIDLLGLSQVEAGEIMGVSKHVIRNWLAGDNPPQPYPMYRLCRAKGLDFNYVFLGDWSSLPGRYAQVLEKEALANLEAAEDVEPQQAES
ncbi:helix-turn-helix transcriptional regulator [Roseomonas sp. NAR14]|uniref:Helix-turn-helix transcriptional regulator n=1 Tax=Roseomonas acroporae TaxID=2937791 RepID=A0A9X1YDK1_9PROT|nr:helix-turn-helix transcriptional regulator [Roseomonas acroporae]MCK8788193.1 helix-turn-helix transcriptional regulator [Roseomonas acroporae]